MSSSTLGRGLANCSSKWVSLVKVFGRKSSASNVSSKIDTRSSNCFESSVMSSDVKLDVNDTIGEAHEELGTGLDGAPSRVDNLVVDDMSILDSFVMKL